MRISDWSSDVCSSDLERKDKGYLYSERRYGSFHRQVSLPSHVDQNGITAQFKDGILTVTLAKDENVPAPTRKIESGNASTTAAGVGRTDRRVRTHTEGRLGGTKGGSPDRARGSAGQKEKKID